MSLPILDTAERGIRRALTRNGLVLMAILFVLSLVGALLDAGVTRLFGVQFDPAAPTELSFALPAAGVLALSLVVSVLSLVVVIGAIRVFVSDETERLSSEVFTRRMTMAWLNAFVGAIVFGIVVALGFVAFVVPGFFLLVALAFWTVYVAVEDEDFLTGMRRSWALTRGNRLSLFALGFVMFLVTFVVSVAFGIVGVLGAPVALVLAQAASAVTTVLGISVLATAYRTLTADDEESPDAPAADPETPGAGAAGGV